MRTETSPEASRRAKKELARRLRSADPGLEVVHPDAAGIDVGNGSHYVAVRPYRDPEPVRRFACFTADLYRMAEWLRSCGAKTVAMQSTGVYWIPLYDILEEFGFEVFLVNARHTKNLPGRKSDVQESQWLLKLHPRTIEQLVPTPIRYSCSENLLAVACGVCNRNGNVYSTHAKIIDTDEHPIGQRNQRSKWKNRTGHRASHSEWRTRSPELAELRDWRIHATKEEIAKSLQGNWRPELLFIVRQQLEMYEAYQRRIAECDQQLREHLPKFASAASTSVDTCNPPQSKKSKRYRYMPQFPLSNELMRISGVDLTQIDGVDAMTAQTLISEVGLDMSRWKTESHFASWLGLCPDNRISGDKVLSRGTRRVINRAATALRIAASTLIRSKTYLGAQYRRLRTKLGAPKAITAMAHRPSPDSSIEC